MTRYLRSRSIIVALVVCLGTHTAAALTVAVDLSYSQSLLMPDGTTRLETLLEALEIELLGRGLDPQSVTVVVSEDQGHFDIRVPRGSDMRTLRAEMADLVPWGTTDLDGLIRGATARSLQDEPSAATPPEVLIVTDAQDPDFPGVSPQGVVLSVICIDTGLPVSSVSALRDLSMATGGSFLAIPDQTVIALTGLSHPPEPGPETGSSPLAGDSQSYTGSAGDAARHTSRGGISWMSRVARVWGQIFRWILLLAVVGGIVGYLKAATRHRRRTDKVQRHNNSPPVLTLHLSGPGRREEHTFQEYPVRIGAGGKVSLPDADSDTWFQLDQAADGLEFTSDIPLSINGVKRTDFVVREGSQIRLGKYRITVWAITQPAPLRLPRKRHTTYLLAPGAAAVAAGVAFLLAGVLPEGQPISPPPDQPMASSESARSSASVPPGEADTTATTPVETQLHSVGAENLPEVDFLAIHAHPDDETLDFGLLISLLTQSGKQGLVVLLTDGQSGIDQFPRRPVGGVYPAYDLADQDLAEVRIEEARRALSHLGVQHLMRIGLANHPYNALTDQLSADQVISRWGGLESLTGVLVEIIDRTNPSLILSPDRPGGAYEHFEHEATGIAVHEAVQRVVAQQRAPLHGHLTGIDPLQVDFYEKLIRIPGWDAGGRPGSDLRQQQTRALREHWTQRDSSVVGVETRNGVPFEYYRVSYWEPGLAGILPASVGPIQSE